MLRLVVNAGPGTGKTYTATSLIHYLRAPKKDVFLKNRPHTEEQRAIWEYVDETLAKQNFDPHSSKILYAAYNREAVEDVKSKLPEKVGAHTIHGAGYQVVNAQQGYVPLNDARGVHLVDRLTGVSFNQNKDRYKWLSTLQYISKLKDELLQPTLENLRKMQAKYDGLLNFAVDDAMPDRIKQLMPLMKTIDRKIGIEYIDQVWLALFLCKTPPYKFGIIDECQDLSPARLALSLLLAENLMFIGDEDQAINAFSGADPDSFDKIRKACNKELQLKTVFRCPPNIIDKANMIAPRAKLRGVKTEPGTVHQVTINDLPATVKSRCHYPSKPEELAEVFYKQHLVICRYNAPLINAALKFFKEGVPAVILGQQLVTQLVKLIEKMKAVDLDDLLEKLLSYEDRMLREAPEHLKEVIYDKGDCIRLVINQTESLDTLIPDLKRLFLPKKGTPHVTLCTVHKAKGRESEHVYILFPPVPSSRATTPSQIQQEKNLDFVAHTRTMNTLTYVTQE